MKNSIVTTFAVTIKNKYDVLKHQEFKMKQRKGILVTTAKGHSKERMIRRKNTRSM